MDTPKSKKLEIVIPAYRWHSQQFFNALDGISDELALDRNDGKTNHVVWMAGNFVNCRYWLANILGIEDKDPNEDLFKETRALDETLDYPTLAELKKNFESISLKLYQKLLEVDDEKLAEKFELGMGSSFSEENILSMIGMCIGREDYLLGQVGLMRKLLGLKGMSYEVNEDLNY